MAFNGVAFKFSKQDNFFPVIFTWNPVPPADRLLPVLSQAQTIKPWGESVFCLQVIVDNSKINFHLRSTLLSVCYLCNKKPLQISMHSLQSRQVWPKNLARLWSVCDQILICTLLNSYCTPLPAVSANSTANSTTAVHDSVDTPSKKAADNK